MYGIMVGRLHSGTANVFQGTLRCSLPTLVQKMAPVQGKVGFLNQDGLIIHQAHISSDLDFSVVYFGTPSDLETFQARSEDFVKSGRDPYIFDENENAALDTSNISSGNYVNEKADSSDLDSSTVDPGYVSQNLGREGGEDNVTDNMGNENSVEDMFAPSQSAEVADSVESDLLNERSVSLLDKRFLPGI